MMIRKCKPLPLILFIITLLLNTAFLSGYSQAYDQAAAPDPLTNTVQLVSMSYAHNPATQALIKTYVLKNVSGSTLTNPRLVNLFLWSNDICSANWVTMGYDGVSAYSNLDQGAIVSGNDGLINWNQDVFKQDGTPYINSTSLFPSLPVQSTQNSISYPYWNLPASWADQATATINVQFSNVQNCNWVQNMVWVIYAGAAGPSPTVIELSKFQAFPGDGTVTLVWTTESEIDTAGFNIYRSVAGSEEMEKINNALIPAKGSSTSGAEYTFTDSDVRNGVAYTYKLEDIDINGTVTEHGPVKAVPRWIYSLFHH